MSTAGVDDRTAKARIRDAAILCFSEHGSETTARKVAQAAGVSPGLVIHHFGSMDGLRSACDEYVAASIRRVEEGAASAGPRLDILAALRDSETGLLMGYLAKILSDDAPAVAKLVDDLVTDAEGYCQRYVEAGMMRPTVNPRGRAAVLVLQSLGVLVMHKHVERILGVDLTDPQIGTDPSFASYMIPINEVYGEGIMTDSFAKHMRESLSGIAGEGAT